MKIISVIGTRPQYIKIKPLYDYFKNNSIDNLIIDTNQHYSENVSKNLIEDLGLHIDQNLNIESVDEVTFIQNGIGIIADVYRKVVSDGDVILVFGDTNSTLVSSLVARKMGLRLAHVEAGVRGGDMSVPEEVNRIVVDSISDIHFTSRVEDSSNVSNPVYVGDLEYNFLHSVENKYQGISYSGPILMTIHRQQNMLTSRLNSIFNCCDKISYPIIFPIHHRTKKIVLDEKINIPSNIKVIEPVTFFHMVDILRDCRGIITDSGGVTKLSPFFGKKCIVPRHASEWTEVFKEGYATNELDHLWFDDYRIDRNMNMYYVKKCCETIVEELIHG